VTIARTPRRMIRGLFGLINKGLKTILVTIARTPRRMIRELPLPPREMPCCHGSGYRGMQDASVNGVWVQVEYRCIYNIGTNKICAKVLWANN
jgi:hypothetical protein